jgi:hypothetical protein
MSPGGWGIHATPTVPLVQVGSSKLVQIKPGSDPSECSASPVPRSTTGSSARAAGSQRYPPSRRLRAHKPRDQGPNQVFDAFSACSDSGTCSAGSGTGASSFACFTRALSAMPSRY